MWGKREGESCWSLTHERNCSLLPLAVAAVNYRWLQRQLTVAEQENSG